MNETVRIIVDAKRVLSSSFVTMSNMATDDETADYWWNKHLDMEEQVEQLEQLAGI